MSEILRIEHLTKTYGTKKAVDDLSLSINDGDLFGFIGHNGAGKTTTLRSAVGILDFEQGNIIVDGHSLLDQPLACKQVIAYLPDNPDLYEYLTGIQYLSFIADIFGIGKQEREARIAEYAGRLELTSNLGDLIGSYSHGMKQKLALIHCSKAFFPKYILSLGANEAQTGMFRIDNRILSAISGIFTFLFKKINASERSRPFFFEK